MNAQLFDDFAVVRLICIAVSPGPGNRVDGVPEREEGAESIFLSWVLPQVWQWGRSSEAVTKISLVFPQSRHK